MESIKENPLYTYKPYTFYNHGPNMPSFEDILKKFVFWKSTIILFKN